MYQNFFKNFFTPDLGNLRPPNGMTGRKKNHLIYVKFHVSVLFVNTIFSSSMGGEYSSIAHSWHSPVLWRAAGVHSPKIQNNKLHM